MLPNFDLIEVYDLESYLTASLSKGHPALIARHRPFPVTHQAAEKWLHHMQQALDNTGSIDPDSRVKMMNFFRYLSAPDMFFC